MKARQSKTILPTTHMSYESNPQAIDRLEFSRLRTDLLETLQDNIPQAGISQDYEDLFKPAAFVLAGIVPSPYKNDGLQIWNEPFSDTTVIAVFPDAESYSYTGFLVTNTTVAHFNDGTISTPNTKTIRMIRGLLKQAEWDSDASQEMATPVMRQWFDGRVHAYIGKIIEI